MLPIVVSVSEVPDNPSLKQVALTVTFHDEIGPVHKMNFSVRVQGFQADSYATIRNRAVEQAKRLAEAFLR